MFQLNLIFAFTAVFFALERIFPGRHLPAAPGWYARSIFLNACQLGIIRVAGVSWNQRLHGLSLFSISNSMPPFAQGCVGWFLGTFVFYWWHRARRDVNLFWRVFHQVHHSPSRIELLTSFYKHPFEMAADAVISALILFPILGESAQGAAWFNVLAAVAEYCCHANLRTPHWFGYFIQRPEHHSIHHQIDVHKFNYGDVTWWDRLFGTFRDMDRFATRCGFPNNNEKTSAACSH